MNRAYSDAPWLFEGERTASITSQTAAPAAAATAAPHPGQHSSRGIQQQRWTPGLVLDSWLMVACFFLVGLGEGDKFVFLQSIARSYPELLDQGLHYQGNFCFTLHEQFNFLTALPQLCLVLGAFMAVVLASRKGRRLSLWVALLLYAVSRLLQTTAFFTQQFLVANFLMAVANGIILQVTIVDMIELSPASGRGTLIACLFAGQHMGTLCGSLLSYGLSALPQTWAWRVVPAYSLWITILLMVLLKGLPETPSNLLRTGRLAEGRAALQEIRGYLADIDDELATLLGSTRVGNAVMPQLQAFCRDRIARLALLTSLTCMVLLPTLDVLAVHDTAKYILLHLVLGRSFRNNSSLSSGLAPAGAYSEISAQMLTTDLARQVFHQQVQTTLLQGNATALVLQQTAQVLGCLLAVAGADALGRRRGACLAFALGGASCVVVSLVVHAAQASPIPEGAASVWAAAAFVLITQIFTSAGFIVFYMNIIEIQPGQTRVLACALTIGVRGMHLFLWQIVIFRWMCSMSSWSVFLAGALLMLAVAAAAATFMLETSQCRTEDICRLWRTHWFWKRFVGPPAAAPFSDKG